MKQVFILLLIAAATLQAQNKKIRRVLFIGNSYTYVNNLPDLTARLASSCGDSLFYDSSSPGGYTFANHFSDAVTKSKIMQGGWDYVVLQAQSQEPSFSPAQVNAQTLPYALKLDSMVDQYNPCAVTVFYETWGRKNGDVSNCAFYPPICTYQGMQNRLRDSYLLFADTCKAVVAPAGEAWRLCIASNPTLELYQSDQSHPVVEGSYLTACVMYQTLFQRSAISGTYNAGLSAGTASFLQSMSMYTMDSLATWKQGSYGPWAAFSATSSGFTYSFTPLPGSLSHTWYFGDNTTSQLANPIHLYTVPGTYTVSHVMKRGCSKDSVTMTIHVKNATSIQDQKTIRQATIIYPQPAHEFINISAPGFRGADLHDLQGRRLCKGGSSVDISSLCPGIYILTVYLQDGTENHRIFKE